MLNENKRPKGCMNVTCFDHRGCSRCGFFEEEAARRKMIPLTLCKDGLMRKLIPRKSNAQEIAPEGGTKDES